MKKEIYLILDNIRSRENVGSIFRTADAVGVKKIFLCGITPIPSESNPSTDSGFANKIAKTALGAEKWVSWEYRAKTWRVLRELKSLKFKVIGLERFDKLTASKLKIRTKNIFSARDRSAFGGKYKDKKIALVVGNEVRGLSPQILKHCDEVVHIPMYGKKESLNVSVATGIAVYQLTLLREPSERRKPRL